MDHEAIWALEERLWVEGISAYDLLVDPACLMAFSGMGVMRITAIREGLKDAPRWTSVKMSDRAIGQFGDDVIVLGYTAEGQRDGEEPYRCICTSTYRRSDGSWKLVQHQQTALSDL